MKTKSCENCIKGGFLKCRNEECAKSGEFKNFKPANEHIKRMLKEEEERNRELFRKFFN